MGNTKQSLTGTMTLVAAVADRAPGLSSNGHGGAPLTALAASGRKAAGTVGRVVSGPLPKGLATLVPGRRKKRSLARRLPHGLARASKVASALGTALGVVATGAEIAAAFKQQAKGDGDDEGNDEEIGRAHV